MKKFAVLLILAGLICSGSFAQSTSVVSIADYFPTKLFGSWTYANRAGKEFETIFVKDIWPDQRDGTTFYLFEEQYKGLGSTTSLYSIKHNSVVLLESNGLYGTYREYPPPYLVVLAVPDRTWQYQDSIDDFHYRTFRTSCKFDDKVFNDCICVEQTVFVEDGTKEVFMVVKDYYAKGVGLVCEKTKGKDGNEGIFMKLTESTFLKE